MNITLLPQYLIETLGWTLIHWLWQGLAVAVILAVVLKAFAKISSSRRYLIGCVGLAAMMVMPMLTFKVLSSRWERPIKVAAVEVKQADAGRLGTIEMGVVENDAVVNEAVVEPVIEISFAQRISSAIETNAGFIVYGWLVGVFGFCLWHLGGWRQLQKLRKTMVKPVGEKLVNKMNKLADAVGVKRVVSLMESALVAGPVVVGWLKPMILLPGSALTGLNPEQLEAILAHELAHIRRCDYLVNIIQTAVEIVGFYNPAIWWVSAKIRAERENCCDDIAVALTGDKVNYVRALTTLEEVRCGYKLAVAGSGGSLFDRAKRLLTKDKDISSEKSLLTAAVAVLLLAMVAIPAGFAISSQPFNGIEKNGIKTVTLAFTDDEFEADSTTISVFDFSDEKTIDIAVDLKGLSKREKGSRWFNAIFAANADLLISSNNKGGIVVFGPSTAKFKGTSLKEISKIGVKSLAAHIRAEEMSRSSDFIDLPFLNQWLGAGEVGALLTEDGMVVVIQAGDFMAGSKKGEFKYIIVGHVDPQNLPEPKLLEKMVVRNKFIEVLEHPELIKDFAKGLFEKIKTADYDYFLNSKDSDVWKEFAIVESYNTYKEYPQLVRWICKTFNNNPIVSIELGEVNASENDWPAINYTLILKDGSTIEGNLRFEYHFSDNNGRWYGIHGIDWHLQDEPIKKCDETDRRADGIKEDVTLAFDEFMKAVRGNDAEKLRQIALEQVEALNFTDAEKQGAIDTLQLDAAALRTYKGIEDLEIFTIQEQNGWRDLLTSEVTDARGVTGRLSFGVFDKNKVILDGFAFVENDGRRLRLRPQILTQARVFIVPADLPLLKDIISDDKSKPIMITAEKLEEFIKAVNGTSGARSISAPKLLTNDGESAEIRSENADGFESIKLNIKNTVQPDRKMVTLELDFEYAMKVADDYKTNNVETKATLLSDNAIALDGGIDEKGNKVILIVQPKVLEAGDNPTRIIEEANAEKQISEFKAKLEKSVTADAKESPTGSGLTVQYAVIAICKAAGVPYNWDKSAKLADPQRRNFINPLNLKDKVASQAILDLTSLAGLAYGVDAGGVYLYKPEEVPDVQSNFEIVNIELEPVVQGKNVFYVTVQNKSDSEQLFGVHIYTRSVDYGPSGVGWATSFFETMKPNEKKRVRLVYKIQGPVTENTYLRLKFYNPETQEQCDYKKPFAVRLFEGNNLPKPEKAIVMQGADKEVAEEILKTFKEMQSFIKKKDYEKAWGLFSEDYQKSEYQRKGCEDFKLNMEPENELYAAFHWDKETFIALENKGVEINTDLLNGRGAKLNAEYKDKKWTIYFVHDSKDDKWKIDDIVGYKLKIIEMQEQDEAAKDKDTKS